MEGLEVNEVNFSETLTNKDFRTDSDFWVKAPKRNPRFTYAPIGSILTTSQYGISIEMNEHNEGYPIYRMNEIHNMLCDFQVSKCASIKKEEFCLFSLNDRDVLFNRTNSYEWVGRTGLFKKQEGKDFIFASYLVRFVPDEKKVMPEYLVAFLSSRYGVWDIRRRARHSINQTNVNPEEIKAIEIPLLSDELQKNIKQCFDKAANNLLLAKQLYTQAETLLLDTLCLTDFLLSTKQVNIKSFKNSFSATGRLDAEYYQLKYEQVEKACLKNALYIMRINEIQLHNSRGLQPDYVENGELDVINSRHILDQELDYKNFEKTNLENWNNQIRARVFRNDILTYTTGANIGRTQIYLSDKKALASNHVNILRIKDENPTYIAFVLNSKIGRLQTEQLSAGSAQQELYPKDIANFYVPFVDQAIQTKICTLIQESFTLKAESARLLETAKRAVEIAIEQNEEAAMKLLTTEIKRISA